MLFKKKEQYKNASDCFFGEMKKGYIKERQDLRKGMNNMTDIDKTLKEIKKKKYADTIVYLSLIVSEEPALLEIIYRTLLHCKIKNINIPEEYFDILKNNDKDPYDKIINFCDKILPLVHVDENEKIGFDEFEIGMHEELFDAEKNRIKYIREKAQHPEPINYKEEVGLSSKCYAFTHVFTTATEKYPERDKLQVAIDVLCSLPAGSFDKNGFSPFRFSNS